MIEFIIRYQMLQAVSKYQFWYEINYRKLGHQNSLEIVTKFLDIIKILIFDFPVRMIKLDYEFTKRYRISGSD